MSTEHIEVLHEQSLKAVLGKPTEGQMADTYQCSIEWSDGSTETGFVKRFLASDTLGILNEITGYLLARACMLPLASKAGILKCPNDAFSTLDDPEFQTYAFVTKALPGKSPGSFYNQEMYSQCKSLLALVAGWPKLADTIAFDDWVANTDRNLGNILVSNKEKIYLIDHSNIPFKLQWEAADLDPNIEVFSKLIQALEWSKQTPLPQKSKIQKAASTHTNALTSTFDELSFWWDKLLSNDAIRRKKLESFIKTRAQLSPLRLGSQFNMLVV